MGPLERVGRYPRNCTTGGLPVVRTWESMRSFSCSSRWTIGACTTAQRLRWGLRTLPPVGARDRRLGQVEAWSMGDPALPT